MFDAWLLLNQVQSIWFRYDLFYAMYPDYPVIRDELEKTYMNLFDSTSSGHDSDENEMEKTQTKMTQKIKSEPFDALVDVRGNCNFKLR